MSIISELYNFNWRQPFWLLLMLQPFLLWLYLYWKNNRTNNLFADKHLLPWVKITEKKSLLQKILSRDSAYWVGMVSLAIAMAGPRIPLESINAKQASALDIMLVVDVSASMKANDIQPSRLQRATQELYELLSLIKRADIRFGSVVYAARPHVFVPITNDFEALKYYLKDLDQLVLPTKGSDASSALTMAGKNLQAINSKQRKAKAILWLTDGDFANLKEQEQIELTLRKLRDKNIPTYILGLGTAEGAAIPLRKGGWLEHSGQGVISKMNVDLLSTFAEIAGGKFSKAYDDDKEWEALYNKGLLDFITTKKAIDSKKEDPQWIEYYQWFLFLGMILLLLSLVPFTLQKAKRKSVVSLLFCALMISIVISYSSEVYAEDLSKNSILKQSIESYNNQEYALATSGFMSIILQAKTDNARGKAMHNLGNNYFQQGDYKNAAQLFEDALRYAPNQIQSQKNLLITNELNTLIQRRTRRGAAVSARQTAGRDQLGNQNQTATMLESRASKNKNLILPDIPQRHLDNLLSRGLEYLEMLDSTKMKEQKQKQRNIEKARISLLRDQDSSLEMWKRLFEIEEGFPAKLDVSRTVPGQRPW